MERIALAPGVNLTAVRDERFKTGAYSLNLLTPLEKETASQRAVLPYVLRRGTARYPEAEELEAALDELYGARLEPFVRKKGEVQAIGFYADFADPAFVDEERMPEKMASLLGEVLLNPAMQSGNLRRERVALERENLLADIRAGINDKGSYADERLLALMCRGENYSVPKLGSLPQAKRIGHLTLT
ncbi:MAG: EF-P 5-aminopentanol modification-associated protein YfmF, partial [bacterium]